MTFIRYVIFVTVLMMASNTHAQNTLAENEQSNNLGLGLFYSLDTNLSGNNIALSEESGYRTEYNRKNFTAGLELQYLIIKSLALQSGLSYSKRGFSGTYYCNVCDFIIPPRQEEIDLQFLQVPAALKYFYYFKNFGFMGKMGLLNQFLVIESNNYELEANSYSLSGVLGAGIKYYIVPGFSTALSANYANGLTPIFKDANYSYKTWGIRLNLSIEL